MVFFFIYTKYIKKILFCYFKGRNVYLFSVKNSKIPKDAYVSGDDIGSLVLLQGLGMSGFC